MANNTGDQEIVELIIDAQNLTTEELKKAAEDVENLGVAAAKTEKELKKLEIERETLASFEKASSEIKQLGSEVNKAEKEFKDLDKAFKKSDAVTDEMSDSLAAAKLKMNQLKTEYKQAEPVFNKHAATVKRITAGEKDHAIVQNKLNASIEKTSKEVKRLTVLRDAQTAKMKEQQRIVDNEVKGYEQLSDELTKVTRETEKKLKADKAAAVELERVNRVIVDYRREIDKLELSLEKGEISTKEFLRAEADLRRALNLTKKEVKGSSAVVDENTKSKKTNTLANKANAKSTDGLTQVTRRLAQAYTVLLAAQKATQAVSLGVENYGALEAAITRVEKTTGIARDQVIGMTDELRVMSEDVTPTATNELLRYAEVAGQLGVKSSEDILKLVSAADALEVSTNLAGDEAATLLSRILTMTNEGIPSIHNLSGAVVSLGNDFAVTEQEIVHMTKEIVSGTRSIDLGAAAAAAFGTTLKELGQPAERSRTAVQRMAEAIKSASLKGGEDLDRLTKITGLTAEAIEKDLGERPETVLISFLEGLSRLKDEGQLVSDSLKSMGIEGTEATSVIGILASNTDRLQQALNLSNVEYEKANAHFREASKAYADQESAIGRLVNKFTALTEKIGEAYSDDTDRAIRAAGDALKTNEDAIIGIMELLPELVEGFLELGGAFEDVFTSIGGLGSAFNVIVNSFKSGFNVISASLRGVGLQFAELRLASAELFGANSADIDRYKKDVALLRQSITDDFGDINEASKRMVGDSSKAFSDLKESANLYSGVISQLSVKEQAQLEIILNKTGYMEGEDEVYRKLTASITRKNRETEIQTELETRALEQTKAATIAKIEEDKGVIKLSESYAKLYGEYTSGAITIEELGEKTKVLTDSLKDHNEAAIVSNDITVRTNELTFKQLLSQGEFLEQSDALVQSYRDKGEAALIEAEQTGELARKQTELHDAYINSSQAITSATSVTGYLTEEQSKLNTEIVKSEKSILDLKRLIDSKSASEGELARATAELRKEETKLNGLRKESAELMAIENASFLELSTLRDRQIQQLSDLNFQFESGIIQVGQYREQKALLEASISSITSLIGEETEEFRKNNETVRENIKLKGELAKAEEEVQRFTSLSLEAAKHLNKEYDHSSLSVSELDDRYTHLSKSIHDNQQALYGFWGVLAETSNKVFEQEKAALRAESAYRDWEDRIKSGSLSLEELNNLVAQSSFYFDELSDKQLDGLISSIDEARNKFRDLRSEINEEIDDIQDRLDLALGNVDKIRQREQEREIAALEELIRRALALGDTDAVRQLEQALRDLRRAQKLEYKAEFGTNTSSSSSSSTNSDNTTGTGTYNYVVTINTPSGRSADISVGSQNDADSLLSVLESLGDINLDGNV